MSFSLYSYLLIYAYVMTVKLRARRRMARAESPYPRGTPRGRRALTAGRKTLQEKPGGSQMAKDTKSNKTAAEEVPGVKPEIVESVVRKAADEGLSPETAKDIMREALEEGVEPEKIEEVAQEAVEVEREDQEKSR
jgi:hypothetical protein